MYRTCAGLTCLIPFELTVLNVDDKLKCIEDTLASLVDSFRVAAIER